MLAEPARNTTTTPHTKQQKARQDKLARRKAKTTPAQKQNLPTPMPHAENSADMSAPTTNGDHNSHESSSAPKSAFLSHLSTYPLITTLTSHPLAQKSLSLATALAAHPLAAKPLALTTSTLAPLVTPYLSRADALGDAALARLDSLVPVPRELYAEQRARAAEVLQRGVQAKEHVLQAYGAELKRGGSEGVVGYGKAAVATGVLVGGEAVKWAWEWRTGGAAAKKGGEGEKQ